MASQSSPAAEVASQHNDVDDLFNYNVSMDDAFNPDNAANSRLPTNVINDGGILGGASAALGIDKEVKVTRQRQPVAKLDETRLLSAAGIPKLRKMAKTKFKFRGKGHEYSDVARLLNIYQLWLDDLYPRAKFADALSIIEKLGHTKRMQVHRKQWIDEAKPRSVDDDTTYAPQDSTDPIEHEGDASERPPDAQTEASASEQRTASGLDAVDSRTRPPADAEPELDELDALLAEEPPATEVTSIFGSGRPSTGREQPNDDYADDLDALADLDGAQDGW